MVVQVLSVVQLHQLYLVMVVMGTRVVLQARRYIMAVAVGEAIMVLRRAPVVWVAEVKVAPF